MKILPIERRLKKIDFSCPLLNEILAIIRDSNLTKKEITKIIKNIEKVRSINNELRDVSNIMLEGYILIKDKINEPTL